MTTDLNPFYKISGGNLSNPGASPHRELSYMAGLGAFLSFLVLVAVLGNLLVVAAVFTDRRLKRNSNFFIVSLAVSDLLMALVVMTFATVQDINGPWVFGAVFCRIWISSDIMCSTASILNLCVISFDRYKHIKDPLRYEAWMSTGRTVTLISSVWVLSILISFLPTHLDWHTSTDTSGNDTSNDEKCEFHLNPFYAIVSSCISFYIPCIIMVSIYARLYMYARRHAEVIRRTHIAEQYNIASNGSVGKGIYKVSDHKAAVTLGVIMGVFLLCWLPFFIVNLIYGLNRPTSPDADLVFKVFVWAGYANSCLNPIIYSIFNTEFRDAFRLILLPKCLLEYRKSFLYSKSRIQRDKSEYNHQVATREASVLRRNSRDRLYGVEVPTASITSL